MTVEPNDKRGLFFEGNQHFDEILDHESEIEARLIGSDCTITDLIVDNERCINDFQNAGERIVLIDSDYKLAIRNLLA